MLTQSKLKELFDYQEDGNLIWKVTNSNRAVAGNVAGSLDSKGYMRTRVDGIEYRIHRLIFAWHRNEWPTIVDHIDRNRVNNRIHNLRELNQSNNHINSEHVRSSTGIRGVTICKKTGKYQSRIMKKYKSIWLGFHLTLEEAAAAYQKAREELFPDAFIV